MSQKNYNAKRSVVLRLHLQIELGENVSIFKKLMKYQYF